MDEDVPPDLRVLTAGEREVLEGFLELYRGIVPRKVAGLGDEEARRSLVGSRTTLLGLVRHLASIEREWFGMVLGGGSAADLGIPADDGWGLGPDDTLDAAVEDYRRACAESGAVAARLDLDDTVAHPHLGMVSVRWVYAHLIEETARHTGHLDILREQTDGTTGTD